MESHGCSAKQRMGALRGPQVNLLRCPFWYFFLSNLQTSTRRPEPHILLFRRPLGTDPVSGEVDPELERAAKEQYQQELAQNLRK